MHEAGGLRGTDRFWGFSWLPGPVCSGFLWGPWQRAGACWAFLSCSFVGLFLGGRVPNWGFSIVLCGVFLEFLCFHVWSIRVIHGMISFFFSHGFGLTDYNIISRICSNIINTLMWAIGMFTAW